MFPFFGLLLFRNLRIFGSAGAGGVASHARQRSAGLGWVAWVGLLGFSYLQLLGLISSGQSLEVEFGGSDLGLDSLGSDDSGVDYLINHK